MAEYSPDWRLWWRDARSDEHPEHDINTVCDVCIEEDNND